MDTANNATSPRLNQHQTIHIIGIGGAGMSAIARVLHGRGLRVTGSDRSDSATLHDLAALGMTVFPQHAADQLGAPDVVVISSAVPNDNPEVMAAQARGVPILKRREFLPHLLADKTQVAVAGTHGKTTTTAMIAYLLQQTGRDPSYIVGGTLLNTADNARAGNGEAFVIEADEYDYMFLGLAPTVAVITNIEHDHPDMFPTLDSTLDAFRQFVGKMPPFDSVLIACADDRHALSLAQERLARTQPTLTYGFENLEARWRGIGWDGSTYTAHGTQFGETVSAQVRLTLNGRHNALNSLAALAAVCALDVPLREAVPHLATFKGTARRLELIGDVAQVKIYSDYGHHPTAIRANLAGLRARYPQHQLWAVWQPHTYSRTRLLADQFATAFTDADHALVTDVYGAREVYQAGDPTGESMAALIRAAGHTDARHSGTLRQTAQILIDEVEANSVVVIFSAGDAPQVGTWLLEALRERSC
ncbi:MAG: UDP-N-acetylmuramate--L-alanine ligase [Anaerolineae bacterium]